MGSWRDISTAPKDATEILVRIKPKLICLGWYFTASSQTHGWVDEGGRSIKPYQWAPLPTDPAPPEEPAP